MSCKSDKTNPKQESNPLDLIMGDKLLSKSPLKIRTNNFKNLVGIPESSLKKNSILYKTEEIKENTFCINQNKSYKQARRFSLIAKTKNEFINEYIVINDFSVMDFLKDRNSFTILCGNHNDFNEYWKTNNDIKVIKYDNSLNIIWEYDLETNHRNFQGLGINNENDSTIVTINLITNCDICFNTYQVKLNEKGKAISVKETTRVNSSATLQLSELNTIFNIQSPN